MWLTQIRYWPQGTTRFPAVEMYQTQLKHCLHAKQLKMTNPLILFPIFCHEAGINTPVFSFALDCSATSCGVVTK
jgi:hypothetical protein